MRYLIILIFIPHIYFGQVNQIENLKTKTEVDSFLISTIEDFKLHGVQVTRGETKGEWFKHDLDKNGTLDLIAQIEFPYMASYTYVYCLAFTKKDSTIYKFNRVDKLSPNLMSSSNEKISLIQKGKHDLYVFKSFDFKQNKPINDTLTFKNGFFVNYSPYRKPQKIKSITLEYDYTTQLTLTKKSITIKTDTSFRGNYKTETYLIDSKIFREISEILQLSDFSLYPNEFYNNISHGQDFYLSIKANKKLTKNIVDYKHSGNFTMFAIYELMFKIKHVPSSKRINNLLFSLFY